MISLNCLNPWDYRDAACSLCGLRANPHPNRTTDFVALGEGPWYREFLCGECAQLAKSVAKCQENRAKTETFANVGD